VTTFVSKIPLAIKVFLFFCDFLYILLTNSKKSPNTLTSQYLCKILQKQNLGKSRYSKRHRKCIQFWMQFDFAKKNCIEFYIPYFIFYCKFQRSVILFSSVCVCTMRLIGNRLKQSGYYTYRLPWLSKKKKNLHSVHVTHLGAPQVLTINCNHVINSINRYFLWWRRSVLSERHETSLYGIKLQNTRLLIHTAVRISSLAQYCTLTSILRYTDVWKMKSVSSPQSCD
jgi:hypothetical protein